MDDILLKKSKHALSMKDYKVTESKVTPSWILLSVIAFLNLFFIFQ